jgi:hypothetical protein
LECGGDEGRSGGQEEPPKDVFKERAAQGVTWDVHVCGNQQVSRKARALLGAGRWRVWGDRPTAPLSCLWRIERAHGPYEHVFLDLQLIDDRLRPQKGGGRSIEWAWHCFRNFYPDYNKPKESPCTMLCVCLRLPLLSFFLSFGRLSVYYTPMHLHNCCSCVCRSLWSSSFLFPFRCLCIVALTFVFGRRAPLHLVLPIHSGRF